ncbi:MAG: BLUF domain-containing protein [Psychroserpens sp.]|uniref:BLUF domain-containing protein n=1 Tax=Psychroserpens sp. TaxID=2020870 RepID=UPI003C74948D
MNNLNVSEDSPIEMLRQFSVHLDGNLIESFGAGLLSFNNKFGSGSISIYELFPGLTAWIYNIQLKSELSIHLKFSSDKPIYLGYSISGYQLQKFPSDENFTKIHQGQNFILISEPSSSSEFIIPNSIAYKCCYLIVNPTLLKKHNNLSRRFIIDGMLNAFDFHIDKVPYRYFGSIDFNIGVYVNILFKNKRTDLVGKLITEGAILNLLASQLDSHDIDVNTEKFYHIPTKSDLSRISELGDYINDNICEKITVAELGQHISMNPKKVQAGIKFLYKCSVNEFSNRIKLEHSKELLTNTDMSVSEICYSVGYQSRSYFSKIFYNHTGKNPSEYRKSHEHDNFIFEISYRSFAVDSMTQDDLRDLVFYARTKNFDLGITGCLIYHEGMFFQLIEGTKTQVLDLFNDINRDKRHKDVEVINRGYKREKDFENWSLASINDQSISGIPDQSSTKLLDISDSLTKIDKDSIITLNLWKKVRNILKVQQNLSV